MRRTPNLSRLRAPLLALAGLALSSGAAFAEKVEPRIESPILMVQATAEGFRLVRAWNKTQPTSAPAPAMHAVYTGQKWH